MLDVGCSRFSVQGSKARKVPFGEFSPTSFACPIPRPHRASMTSAVDSLGIIAGNRSLPLAFAKEARRQGVKRLVAVAVEGRSEEHTSELQSLRHLVCR